jgi:hypothetical protein
MEPDIVLKHYRITMKHLHHEMQKHYALFQSGFISEKEYLSAIKPLDKAIDTLEMSILKEYLVWQEASSIPFHVPEK